MDSNEVVLQTIQIRTVSVSCEEPIVATVLSTRKGSHILITIVEYEKRAE